MEGLVVVKSPNFDRLIMYGSDPCSLFLELQDDGVRVWLLVWDIRPPSLMSYKNAYVVDFLFTFKHSRGS